MDKKVLPDRPLNWKNVYLYLDRKNKKWVSYVKELSVSRRIERNLKIVTDFLDIEWNTILAAENFEKKYFNEIKDGTVGYALAEYFDTDLSVLEEGNLIEVERFKNVYDGIVVYRIERSMV